MVHSRVSDVIGIDFTPGTRSEDLQFFGKNTGLNAEIKKEYVVTLTRKVTDNTFDQLFNYPARNGVYATGGADSGDGGNRARWVNNFKETKLWIQKYT